MNKHLKYLLNGVMLIVPLVATVYIIGWVAFKLDEVVLWGASVVIGEARAERFDLPFPGVGLLGTVVVLYAIGRLGQLWLFTWIVNVGERVVGRIPLIKTLYSSVRDMLNFVVGDHKESAGRAVIYNVPGSDIKMMGVVTSERPPSQFSDKCEGNVCVYFPMSYQLGGYTMMVPPDALETVDVDGMVMMRLAMTGGVGSKQGAPEKPKSPLNRNLNSAAE